MTTQEIPVLSLAETLPDQEKERPEIPEVVQRVQAEARQKPVQLKPARAGAQAGSRVAAPANSSSPRTSKTSGSEKKPRFFEGAPSKDEWQDFIGNSVLKWVCRGYVWFVTRGIDDNQISKEDKQDLQMTDEDLDDISRPFASLMARSKFNAKSGRAIIDSADAIDATMALFFWMKRVNQVTRRYKQTELAEVHDISSGQDVQQESWSGPGFSPGYGG